MSEVEPPIDTVSSETELIAAKFQQLTQRWRERAEFLSSTTEMAMLPEYQLIIGMGPAAAADLPDNRDWCRPVVQ